jgi:hypothetical protein
VSRLSSRSSHFASSHSVQLPLKGYFLWVGSTLLIGLLAVHWVLPAPPPNPLISSRVILPPIRVYSETRAPEKLEADHDPIAVAGALTEIDAPAASGSPNSASEETIQLPPTSASMQNQIVARRRAASEVRATKSRAALAQFITNESEPMRTTQAKRLQTHKKG